MKMKAAILGSDIEFMDRLAKILQQRYADKISLLMFSKKESLYQSLEETHADIVLFDSNMEIEHEKIPSGTVAGYLGSIPEVDEINGVPAICKYQKVETIYNMLLSLYRGSSSDVKRKTNGMGMRVVMFTSVQGGGGTSLAAASYASEKAAEGKKIFYLNLEKFGNVDLYFQGDGKLSFSDVIYTLKSNKGNLLMKLENAVQKDSSGVEFFSSCKNAYDMVEFSDGDLRQLIEEILCSGKYEEMVIDLSGDLSERMLMLIRNYVDRIVYVTDGSFTGNGKFERFCEAVGVMEQKENCNILNKMCLIYNRYSSKNSVQLGEAAVPVVGGIHRFEGVDGKKLVIQIAQTADFSKI